jgi:hypothetical protein
MIIGRGNPKLSEKKICPSGTLYTINPTRAPLGLNPEARRLIYQPIYNNLNISLTNPTNDSHLKVFKTMLV